jgi:hypothetical protein
MTSLEEKQSEKMSLDLLTAQKVVLLGNHPKTIIFPLKRYLTFN